MDWLTVLRAFAADVVNMCMYMYAQVLLYSLVNGVVASN